jgi:hypothetical protein
MLHAALWAADESPTDRVKVASDFRSAPPLAATHIGVASLDSLTAVPESTVANDVDVPRRLLVGEPVSEEVKEVRSVMRHDESH